MLTRRPALVVACNAACLRRAGSSATALVATLRGAGCTDLQVLDDDGYRHPGETVERLAARADAHPFQANMFTLASPPTR